MNQTVDPRSVPQLLSDVARELTTLFRKEGQLIRAELSEKATQLQVGAGFVLAGAICLLAALMVLLQAVVIGLTNAGLNPGWASLIVGVVVALVGVVLLRKGASRHVQPDARAHRPSGRQGRQSREGASTMNASARQIEREVEASRANLEETVEALKGKMSLGQMVDEAAGYFKESGGERDRRQSRPADPRQPAAACAGRVGACLADVGARPSAHQLAPPRCLRRRLRSRFRVRGPRLPPHGPVRPRGA